MLVSKQLYVEAVPVTEDTMMDIAKWCGGKLELSMEDGEMGPAGTKFIKVPVIKPFNDRQTQAFVGDWVIKSSRKNFKVYTDKAFKDAFDKQLVTQDA